MFALSDGHVGRRGNLDEGEPHGLPGSYLGGVRERRPLPYAEAGYGCPESGQTVRYWALATGTGSALYGPRELDAV